MTNPLDQLKEAIFAQSILIKHEQPDFDEIRAWGLRAVQAARLLHLEAKDAPGGNVGLAMAALEEDEKLYGIDAGLGELSRPATAQEMEAVRPVIEKVKGLQ